jgi:hypothetical protein
MRKSDIVYTYITLVGNEKFQAVENEISGGESIG